MLTLADIRAMSKEASEKSRNRPDFEIYTFGDYALAKKYFPVSAAKYEEETGLRDPDFGRLELFTKTQDMAEFETWLREFTDQIAETSEKFRKAILEWAQTLPTAQRLQVYLVHGMDLKTLSKADAAQLISLAEGIVKQAETNKKNAQKPRKPTAKGLETTEDIANQVRRDYALLLNTRKGMQKKAIHAELATKYRRSTRTIQGYLKKCISGATA